MAYVPWEERRQKLAQIGKRGKGKNKVKITLTANMVVSMSIYSAAFLYENPDHEMAEEVKALYDMLPDRESLYKTSKWGDQEYRYIGNKTRKYPFDVELLPTVVFMLKRAADGPGSSGAAMQRRIKDIEALPTLQLLALADVD